MTKKLTILIIMIGVLLFSTTTVNAEMIDTNHWAKNYINWAIEQQLFQGTSNETFSPNQPITRAELATVICRQLNANVGESDVSVFTDIENHWANKQIAWCYENKITNGVSNGVFAPDKLITRQDACVMIAKAMNYTLTTSHLPYTDKDYISEYAKPYISILTSKSALSGYSDGRFNPFGTLTRAEACVVFAKINGVYKENYIPKGAYIGSFKSTFYCPGSCCNGGWSGQTALGVYPTVGRTIAVDRRIIPLGTWVYVEYTDSRLSQYNGYYRAEDTGGAIRGNRIDMLLGSHSQCNQAGVGYCNIYYKE